MVVVVRRVGVLAVAAAAASVAWRGGRGSVAIVLLVLLVLRVAVRAAVRGATPPLVLVLPLLLLGATEG